MAVGIAKEGLENGYLIKKKFKDYTQECTLNRQADLQRGLNRGGTKIALERGMKTKTSGGRRNNTTTTPGGEKKRNG